jgi:hypothetical protein
MQTSAKDRIATSIATIRNRRVILDSDIAALYGVPTKALAQAVRRNIDRSADFMFQLSDSEWRTLRSQIVASKNGRGRRRYPPMCFTEQGVAMLSSLENRIETRLSAQDQAIAEFMRAIRDLIASRQTPKRPIGFVAEESRAAFVDLAREMS